MEEYITKDGKRLRLGYTTGSCAAAASKAAAWMLMTGTKLEKIGLQTPKGISLELDVLDISMKDGSVSCAIKKDGGDDPDITDGILIYSTVAFSNSRGIVIDGGEGVGRVTKPGLDQVVGRAAINSVPLSMILKNVEDICMLFDYRGGLSVCISVPQGRELAKRTFNPRLGIVGGISILGTTGIVEPMSEQALIDTIFVELRQRRATGAEYALLTPGNYGIEFIRNTLGLPDGKAVQVSNFMGEAMDACRKLGFRGVLIVGHIGKLVKLAGGMFQTHSKYGDCRMEILAAHAGACGLPADAIRTLLQCATCDDALALLRQYRLDEAVLQRLTTAIADHLCHRSYGEYTVGAILFSKVYGPLCRTQEAENLLSHITEE